MREGSEIKQRPESFYINNQHPLACGLRFAGLGRTRGSLTYRDESPYRNHGTLTGMAIPATATSGWQYVPQLGRMGTAFDGSDDEITAIIPQISVSSFSAAFWGWWDGLDIVVVLRDSTTVVGTGTFFPLNSTTVQYRVGGTSLDSGSAFNLYNSAWHHWTLTGIGTTASLYVDGKLLHSGSGGTGAFINPWHFGRNGGGVEYSKLLGSDLVFWNRPLSPSEINILANPSDPMLGGLLEPLWPRVFAAAVAGGNRRRRVICTAG